MEIEYLLNKYKNKLLNILILVLFCFAAAKIYNLQKNSKESLNTKKEEADKKNIALSDIAEMEKRIAGYKKILAQNDSSYFINKFSNLARDAGIKIISVSPLREITVKGQAYTRQPFSLVVSASSYHAIAKFISSIENATDVFIVDDIEINLIGEAGTVAQAEKMSLKLAVSAVFFKG